MEPLLFLAHRIPFPPNKGDKIRSYNLLKALSKHYDIYLAAFIDDPADREAHHGLSDICREIYTQEINPAIRRIMSLTSLISKRPITVDYYRNVKFQKWVTDTIEADDISKIVCFSAAMAQFVDGDEYASQTRVIDFVDVDSQKWREYSDLHRWPRNWIYKRESETLKAYEVLTARKFNAATFVTDAEVSLFRNYTGVEASKIYAVQNGVDTEYFSPNHCLESPYRNDEIALVFTGAMDYWANVDAVTWFASEIYPRLQSQIHGLGFWVVGARPTKEVKKLAEVDGIHVTGAVPDVRPYIRHATLAVAPLRIARGVQNKVLEAMSMAKPVVATLNAMEGIAIDDRFSKLIADEPNEIMQSIISVLKGGPIADLGAAGREYVLDNHNWDAQTKKLVELLETVSK